jgi:hypothetical protein
MRDREDVSGEKDQEGLPCHTEIVAHRKNQSRPSELLLLRYVRLLVYSM